MLDYATIYWTIADNADWIIPAGVGASVILAVLPKRTWHLPPSPPSGACTSPPPMSGFTDSERRKVERAWNLAETTPNAHLLASIHNVSKGHSEFGATGGGGHVTIDRNIDTSEAEIAATFLHEATHCHERHAASTPETEAAAFRQENIARRALGLSRVSESFDRHRALGYRDDGTRVTPAELKKSPSTSATSSQTSSKEGIDYSNDGLKKYKYQKKLERWRAEGWRLDYREITPPQTVICSGSNTPPQTSSQEPIDYSNDGWKKYRYQKKLERWRAEGWRI